jgi:hypothetical protein
VGDSKSRALPGAGLLRPGDAVGVGLLVWAERLFTAPPAPPTGWVRTILLPG